jgi:cell division protease FtsH
MTHSDPVHRVTIIPRSIGALGATLTLPTQERFLMTREELRDRICVLLGGRSAEEIACQDVSTGAEDDLARATEMARHMVCRFGMSDALGSITIDRGGSLLSPWGSEWGQGRNVSEATLRLVDAEVKAIIEREHARAREQLGHARRALDAIASELLVRETLQRADLEALVSEVSGRRSAVNGLRNGLRQTGALLPDR